jgi:hypothetical protein
MIKTCGSFARSCGCKKSQVKWMARKGFGQSLVVVYRASSRHAIECRAPESAAAVVTAADSGYALERNLSKAFVWTSISLVAAG